MCLRVVMCEGGSPYTYVRGVCTYLCDGRVCDYGGGAYAYVAYMLVCEGRDICLCGICLCVRGGAYAYV